MTEFFLVSTLVFFIVVSTLLSVVTLGNALRLRRIKLSWKSGHVMGYPIFSAVFLLFLVLFSGVSIVYYGSPDYAIFMSYLWIGLNWFISSYLMSKRFITEHGIVKNVNDPSQTIGWGQVTDYFEQSHDKFVRFIFVYQVIIQHKKELHRIELDVPNSFISAFRELISLKLARRFDWTYHQYSDYKSIL
jgi:hypothetical protein